jgi:FkbM family methyltransferase
MTDGTIPRLRDHLTPPSRFKYFLWRLGFLGKGAVLFRHGAGPRLLVRPDPAGDLITAYEVFVSEIYRPPWNIPPDAVRSVVDLGGNIGLSAVYFAHKYPEAKLDLFEPHPAHVALLRRQIAANRLESRVQVHPVAAAVAEGSLYLRDAGTSSALESKADSGTIPVAVIDWLDWAHGRQIDLLKIDVEGAEYPIFLDPRIAQIRFRWLVVEWHRTDSFPTGKTLMQKRLQELGLETAPGVETSDLCGLIWARRV